MDPRSQDRRRAKFDKDQSLEHMNATGRCSRWWEPTIETLKAAGKWSDEMVPGPRLGSQDRKVRLLNIDRKLWIVTDGLQMVLFYAEVVDKDRIDLFYDRIDLFYDQSTAARYSIVDFAKSKAPCYSGRA